MRKLLSANLSRLLRSRIFWTLEGISAITGAAFYALAVINTRNISTGWYLDNGNYYFFLVLFCIGIVMAVFTSFYVGTEYSEGTIRNKLSAGHSRTDIYFANLTVAVIAGILFTLAYILASICVGLPFLGGLIWDALAPVGWRILMGFLVLLCYGTIFTLFSMLDSSKSRNVIVTFALSLLIILGGIYTSSRLQQPELIPQMIMQEDGSYQLVDGYPNSLYISGTTRTAYAIIDACIPSSQANAICRRQGEFNPLSAAGLLAVCAIVTSIGVLCFKKKDIK